MPTHSLYLTTDIPTTTPAIPNISCDGRNNSLVMTFSANSDGGTPITSYQYSIDNFAADINTIDINSSPYTINNLQNGLTFNIELRAVNKNGVGEYTNSPDITPASKPTAPTINNIVAENASATIYYSAPATNNGSIIDYYIITFSSDEFVTSTSIAEITTNPFTISGSGGLTNATTYKFKLQAHNGKGNGDFSNIFTKAMPTIPSAPVINSIATPTNKTATINFTAASNGGLDITNYQYSTDAGASFTAFNPVKTTTPLTITGLTPGQPYNIQIRAVNSINPGTASASYPITMPNNPSATGGTIIPNVGGYKYHIFKDTGSNQSITFTQGGAVEYLIIAGGGAGGSSHGGGGGAGEVFQDSTTALIQSYTNISVGIGGTTSVTNGGDSSAFSITCKGGGRGGGASGATIGISGGSGGGGSGYTSSSKSGGATTKTANLPTGGGLGNKGGDCLVAYGPSAAGGGGGGGAGDVGQDTPAGSSGNSSGGTGGPGTNTYSVWINAISSAMGTTWGSKTTGGFIASGGAGGSWGTANGVVATIGGGGSGGTANQPAPENLIPPTPGTANTGGGGGGGSSGSGTASPGASGGSGLVVIRYLV